MCGGGLEVLQCFVRGGQNFFFLLCVFGGGVRGGQAQYFSFREKKQPTPSY